MKLSRLYDLIGRRVTIISAIAVVLSLAQFVVEMAMALSLQSLFYSMGLIDDQPSFLQDQFPYDDLIVVLAFFLAVGTVRSLVPWAQTYVMGVLTVDLESRIRSKLIQWAFGNRTTRMGEVADLFNDKTTGAANFISSLLKSVSRIVVAALLLISLFGISVKITFAVVVTLLVLPIPMRYLEKHIQRVSAELHKDIGLVIERLLLGVKNSLLLHIHGTFRLEEERAQNSLQSYRHGYNRYFMIAGFKGMLPFLFGIWLIAFIAFGAREIETIESALLVSYLYLFLRFVQSLSELTNLRSYLTLTLPRMRVIWDWWQKCKDHIRLFPSIIVGDQVQQAPAGMFDGPVGWQLENIALRYGPDQPSVLQNLSLKIAPGSMQLITGRSGSGKSSLLSLLLGLNTANDGCIFVIDKNGKKALLEDVRSNILALVGYVGPESLLIPGTIRENLDYGVARPHAEDEIRATLMKAECGFVFDLPGGLEHRLTEQGEGLSAGQKQRLSLARALLRDPRILILDEATSNLDKETEATLIETFGKLKGKITICAVSHREAIGKIADDILNLE